MQKADPEWVKRCIAYGLGSGDGLVERVKDVELEPQADDDGNVGSFTITQAGAEDKRLLAYESEFASLFKQLRREGNTLSPMLRNAWDGKTLEIVNRKKNALRSTNAHISVLGNITPDELINSLHGTPEVLNGFSNRFLFVGVKRSRLLPHGGDATVLDQFIEPLAEALAKAKSIAQVRRSSDADKIWEEAYADLAQARAGAYGKATERARPQAMRLALIYALADGSDVIEAVHLKAALALWDYCEASAKAIFAESVNTQQSSQHEDEPLALVLLNAITRSPGLNRTAMRDVVGHKVSVKPIEDALAWLEENGLPIPSKPDTKVRGVRLNVGFREMPGRELINYSG